MCCVFQLFVVTFADEQITEITNETPAHTHKQTQVSYRDDVCVVFTGKLVGYGCYNVPSYNASLTHRMSQMNSRQ